MQARSLSALRWLWGAFALLFWFNANAALPPDAVKDALNRAEEKLVVEFLNTDMISTRLYHHDVLHTVRVVAVEASHSGLVVGDIITIDSYYVEVDGRYPGPMVPALPAQGWTGKVYLNRNADSGLYDLACNGHSIELNDNSVLPEHAISNIQHNAPEQLVVQIQDVTLMQDPYYRPSPVLLQAKVLAVDSTQTGIMAGDIIVIDSYYVKPEHRWYGSASPDLLPQGWIGKVYVKQDYTSGQYYIVGGKHSFIEGTAFPWNATTVYLRGDIVTYNGQQWRARYWTRGDKPNANDWSAWEQVQ